MIDDRLHVIGVMTAGDLTRSMEREHDILAVPLDRVINKKPKIARHDELASAVVYRMEKHGIMAMPVIGASPRSLLMSFQVAVPVVGL